MAVELIRVLAESVDTPLWLLSHYVELGRLDGLIFSGGVAEHVYGTDSRPFGDLGPALGRMLAAGTLHGRLPVPLLPTAARPRATVLGARHAVRPRGRALRGEAYETGIRNVS